MENLRKQALDLFNNKSYKKSLSILLNLLEKDPKSLDLLLFTSYNYMQIQKYENALIYFEKIIQLNKNLPQVFYNRGICYSILSKTEEAIKNFKKAISLKEDYLESYIQLGQLLKKLNLLDEAIFNYKLALPKVDRKDSINVNISEIYYLKKEYELSKKYSHDALKINEKNYFANINIANCLVDQGDVQAGIVELEKAKSINSNYSMIYNNLGFCYRILGNDEKAAMNYKKAIELNPNLHDAYFNLSHIQLSQSNFEDGWKNYEYRWGTQKKFSKKLKFEKPLWSPNMGFKRILIWGEQGIGEQLLFITILTDIVSKFEKIIICAEDKLVELFQRRFTNVEVYPLSKKIYENEFDYHLPICSLARFFRNSPNSFPNVNKNRQKKFSKKNVRRENLKCAISWRSKNQDSGNIKSIRLEDLKEILLLDKIDFFNIQYTNEDKEVEDFRKKYNVSINKEKNLDTFNDLLGLSDFISSCDFVITVSNTNAHLSASIGKPTFLLLPKTRGKFWYWENDKDGKNLWYPSIIKFKQNKQGEWSDTINHLKNFLLQKYF